MKGNPYLELIERLKAYEDTGLEPGEIIDMAIGYHAVCKALHINFH